MLASHKLNVIAIAKPVRQKIRRFHSDRHQIIQIEVDNLLSASFIRKGKYPEWLVITTQIVLFHTLNTPCFEHFLCSSQPN